MLLQGLRVRKGHLCHNRPPSFPIIECARVLDGEGESQNICEADSNGNQNRGDDGLGSILVSPFCLFRLLGGIGRVGVLGVTNHYYNH